MLGEWLRFFSVLVRSIAEDYDFAALRAPECWCEAAALLAERCLALRQNFGPSLLCSINSCQFPAKVAVVLEQQKAVRLRG